jgi:hypothetical protein
MMPNIITASFNVCESVFILERNTSVKLFSDISTEKVELTICSWIDYLPEC